MKVSYDKAVSKIEKFMKDSGIRDICSNFCIGNCCETCYESEKACHKNEGRRLACSFYMCPPLKELLFTEYEEKVFNTINRIVVDTTKEAMNCDRYLSIYFEINDQSTRDKFSIDIKVLNRLNKINRRRVANKSNALRELYRNFDNAKKANKQ